MEYSELIDGDVWKRNILQRVPREHFAEISESIQTTTISDLKQTEVTNSVCGGQIYMFCSVGVGYIYVLSPLHLISRMLQQFQPMDEKLFQQGKIQLASVWLL